MSDNSSKNDDRSNFQDLLAALYAARVSGELDALASLFAEDALFRISGSSDGRPIDISAADGGQVRAWLAVLVKTFRLSAHEILWMAIDGQRAAVHWRASIHSRITGATVATELVDLVEVRDGKICSYIELFVPR